MAKVSRSRRRSRPSRSSRLWRFFGAVAALVALIALGGVAVTYLHPSESASQSSFVVPPVDPTANPLTLANAIARPTHAVYPYSVIPGGVDSVEALKSAIRRDPVVAAHYKDFDLSRAHVERLDTPRVAHVSYRLADHVYWTSKALVLPAGERVITDGSHIARTRCGNQLATAAKETSAAEPPPQVMDTPMRPAQFAALNSTHPASLPGGSAAPMPPGAGGLPLGPSGVPGGIVPGIGGTPAGGGPEGPSGHPDTPPSGRPPTAGDPPLGPPPGSQPPSFPPGGPQPPNDPPHFVPPGGPWPPDNPTPPENPPGDPGCRVNCTTTPPHDDPKPVPEPGSLLLMLTGLGGIVARRRRRR